jgi:ATP-binding cassette subfamily B multidrug efflux pump
MSKTDIDISPQNHITIPGFFKLFRYPLLYGAAALVVINLLDVCLPLIVRYFIDNLTSTPSVHVVQWCLLAYVSTAVIQCVCRYSWRLLLGNTGARAATLARFEVARVALGAPHKVSIGETVAVAHNDADVFSRALDGGVIITIDALFGAISIPLILLYLDPALAWKVLLPLPFITFLTIYFDGRVRVGAHAVQIANAHMTKTIESYISDVRMIKANTFESSCLAHFEKASAELRDSSKRFSITESLYGPGLESFISLGLVSLMVFGAPAAYQGHLSLGTFLAFHTFVQQLQWPMRALALAATTFRKAQVSGKRLRDFSKEYDVPAKRNHPSLVEDLDSKEAPVLLSFGAGSNKVEVKKGDVIALIGPNGSGKSRLLKQLAGVEEITPGLALLKGSDLSVINQHQIDSFLGFVLQEPELFALTIQENLLLGGDEDILYTDDDLWNVLHLSAIDEEVKRFPDGLATLLGEKGTSLSGGQKQRISLARTLLRNPTILLLDNSFAALDAETEKIIIENLRKHGFTMIIVTHRLSAIALCDITVVMREGDVETILNTKELLHQPHGWAKSFIEDQRSIAAVERVGEDLLSKRTIRTE